MLKTGIASIVGSVWAMRPDAFDSMCGTLQTVLASGVKLDAETPDRGLRWMAGGRATKGATVAVMGLYGMIDKRSSMMMDIFGGTSTDTFGAVFDELVADPGIKGIVIDTDSPGGTALGVPELSRKIFDARSKKPIVAVANAEMNSAAYWIGSSAAKVFIAPSASAGSVGVWSAAAEYSKQLEADGVNVQVWRATGSPLKAEFLPWKEFTAEAVAYEQQQVDAIYDDFAASVARNRGVTVNAVKKGFGNGRVMNAQQAVAVGLADKIATIEDVIRRMQAGRLDVSASNEKLDAAFADELPADPPAEETPDESWREMNATERLRSRLRMKGVLA